MRRAASGLFNWAAEAGRDYITASPCVNLPKLDEEHPRDRVLSEDEIRTLWHGLDRNDLPWDRKTRLAIKFALVSVLRSGEMLPIHRDEMNAKEGTVDIPARRVKKRRVINQPLSDLALEIITESMGNYDHAFTGRFGNAPLARNAMANALLGTKTTKNGKVKSPGLCELLGIAPFTPHDLRHDVRRTWLVGGQHRALSRPSGEQGRERQAAAVCHPQGLQSRHAHHRHEEARSPRQVGCRVAADHRRACGGWAAAGGVIGLCRSSSEGLLAVRSSRLDADQRTEQPQPIRLMNPGHVSQALVHGPAGPAFLSLQMPRRRGRACCFPSTLRLRNVGTNPALDPS
jgi:integrase